MQETPKVSLWKEDLLATAAMFLLVAATPAVMSLEAPQPTKPVRQVVPSALAKCDAVVAQGGTSVTLHAAQCYQRGRK